MKYFSYHLKDEKVYAKASGYCWINSEFWNAES